MSVARKISNLFSSKGRPPPERPAAKRPTVKKRSPMEWLADYYGELTEKDKRGESEWYHTLSGLLLILCMPVFLLADILMEFKWFFLVLAIIVVGLLVLFPADHIHIQE